MIRLGLALLGLAGCNDDRKDLDGDGVSVREGDCDDSNSAVSPNEEEVCGDGLDNDCDESNNDECRLTGQLEASGDAAQRFDGHTEEGFRGYAVSGTGGDITNDSANSRYDDYAFSEPGRGAGFVFIAKGGESSCNGDCVELFELVGETPGDWAGASLAAAGDINSDGIPDLLVGAPNAGTDYSGKVYIVNGPITANGNLANESLAVFVGNMGDNAGVSVSSAGDQNGDGKNDILIGSPGNNKVYLVLSPFSGEIHPSHTNVIEISSGDASDAVGVDVSGDGDVNGDGIPDFAIGAAGSDAGGCQDDPVVLGGTICSGEVGVFLGPVTTDQNFEDAQVRIIGQPGEELVKVDLTSDIDGDGIDDLILGAPGYSWSQIPGGYDGAAYIFYGQVWSQREQNVLITDEADVMVTGGVANGVGISVGSVDFNNDGLADPMIGVNSGITGYSDTSAGALMLFYGGSLLGEYNIRALDQISEAGLPLIITGDDNSGLFSYSISPSGDYNGDGVEDIVVGAPKHNTNRTDAGSALVFAGSSY